MARANPASGWGRLCNTRKENACAQVGNMDVFIAILHARRGNVYFNFYCGVCATLIFCYKIASVA